MIVSINLYLLFFDDLIITDLSIAVKYFLVKRIIYFGARTALYTIYSSKADEGVGGTLLTSPRLARRKERRLIERGINFVYPQQIGNII